MWFPSKKFRFAVVSTLRITHPQRWMVLLLTHVNDWDSNKAACKVGKVLDNTVCHIGDCHAQRRWGYQRLNDHSYSCRSTYTETPHLPLHLYLLSAEVDVRSHGWEYKIWHIILGWEVTITSPQACVPAAHWWSLSSWPETLES